MRTLRTLSLIVLTCVLFTPFANAELDESRSTQAVSAIVATVEGSDLVFSVHDHAATKVRLQIFDTTTDALVHDSGMVEGSVVRFSTLDLGPETMRYSIRAWDDAETLVTHQITTIAQTEIASLDFDTIEVGFKFAADTIDLDGNTVVTGASGDPALEVIPAASTWGIRVDATLLTGAQDAIEIEMGVGGDPGAQAIEIQRGSGSTDRTAQINADGEAWFQDENKPLPKFLPIAFGSVNSNGTVAGGSGNFSVTLSSSVYKITVTGHTIAWPDYSVVATSHNIIPTVPYIWMQSGEAWVTQRDVFNDNDVTGTFHFVIYEN
jgi:hypothetical protein